MVNVDLETIYEMINDSQYNLELALSAVVAQLYTKNNITDQERELLNAYLKHASLNEKLGEILEEMQTVNDFEIIEGRNYVHSVGAIVKVFKIEGDNIFTHNVSLPREIDQNENVPFPRDRFLRYFRPLEEN